jgi:membrane-associated phospholipid phosphatase
MPFRRLLDRPRALVVTGLLALTVALTPPVAERYGDRLQIALPVIALACSALTGEAQEFVLRYGVMFLTAHGTKRALGDAGVNDRPHGGSEGMPSAHTSTAVLGASALVNDCLRGSPVAQGTVLLAAGFTGASRIDAGAHTIWQVLAGAVWGWVCDRALRRPSPARRAVAGVLARIWRTVLRAVSQAMAVLRGRA